MCKVLDPITDITSFTGYKIVIKKDNKYYSPVTGIEYIPGQKVTSVLRYEDINKDIYSEDWRRSDILPSENNNDPTFYDKNMEGKTGVFKSIKDAMLYVHVHEMIIKMTISCNLHNASFGFINEANLVVGEFIEKMEEISE